MKDLIEYLAKSLVDEPDAVSVEAVDDDEGALLKLKVAKDDLGKVIGKKGRTAKAMRTLLSAATPADGRAATLEILE
jgi:predicted RNA-binding protein YlqC (UPF0109 family)